MERWSGRVALVTGASSGIGLALAESLASYGLRVVACARDIEKIQEVSYSFKLAKYKGLVHAVKCDLSKEDDIQAMFDMIKTDFGGVDICINNAGVGHDAPLISGDTQHFRNMLEVNVLGLTLCTREAVQSMISRNVDDGHIIHISSIRAYFLPTDNWGMYSATKQAVRALTEGLRNELMAIKSKIHVSAISPGRVETEFEIRVFGESGRQKYKDNPVLQAGDIVDAVIYQLSAPPHVHINDIIIRPTGQLL